MLSNRVSLSQVTSRIPFPDLSPIPLHSLSSSNIRQTRALAHKPKLQKVTIQVTHLRCLQQQLPNSSIASPT